MAKISEEGEAAPWGGLCLGPTQLCCFELTFSAEVAAGASCTAALGAAAPAPGGPGSCSARCSSSSSRRLFSSACRAATLQKDTTVRQQDTRASSKVKASSEPSLENRAEGLSFWGRMVTYSFSFISSLLSRPGERRACFPSVESFISLLGL